MASKLHFSLLVLFFMFSINGHAQLLPPDQPEQDACNALLLCGNSFFTPYSYQGTGLVSDMTSTPCGGGEGNSVWLKVVVNGAGRIVFSIIPVDSTDDYDFAVVDASNTACDSITPSDVVRCNFNNNLQPNSYYSGGIVGLDTVSTVQTVYSGTYGNPFLQEITASPGDVYLIMINNFGGTGGPSSGFTIDFTGSTATFAGNGTPAYDSLSALPCGTITSMTVHMSTSILCSSIAADGSDFRIVPPVATVSSATGFNCSGSNGYTQSIDLTFSNPVPAGSYVLKPQTGSDGNTLLDLCGTEQLLTDSIPFLVSGPILNAGPDTATCVNNMLQLEATIENGIAGNQITWAPATFLNNDTIANPLCAPDHDITYVVTATPYNRPECATSDSIHISVLQGFHLLNHDTLICIGQSVAMHISGDNRYTYAWTPASGLSNPSVPNPTATPDSTITYTLTASYPGCTDSMQSVTVTVDSGLYTPFYFTADRDRICSGETIYFTPYAAESIPMLTWSFGDGDSMLVPNEPVRHAYDRVGSHVIRLTARFPACPDTTVTDTVYVYPMPRVHLGPDTTLCLDGAPIMLRNMAVNAPDDSYRYQWNTGDTAHTLVITHYGLYSLVVTSSHNCAAGGQVNVKKDCYIDIPNAFTPNGDGENDYFFPRQLLSQRVTGFKMQVFNRWGQVVFETQQANGRGWDGKFNGRDQPEGVYVYLIEATIDGIRPEKYQGSLTLIR